MPLKLAIALAGIALCLFGLFGSIAFFQNKDWWKSLDELTELRAKGEKELNEYIRSRNALDEIHSEETRKEILFTCMDFILS